MKALKKAKEELRKHLLESRSKVKNDLHELRKKSEGDDYIKYISNL